MHIFWEKKERRPAIFLVRLTTSPLIYYGRVYAHSATPTYIRFNSFPFRGGDSTRKLEKMSCFNKHFAKI